MFIRAYTLLSHTQVHTHACMSCWDALGLLSFGVTFLDKAPLCRVSSAEGLGAGREQHRSPSVVQVASLLFCHTTSISILKPQTSSSLGLGSRVYSWDHQGPQNTGLAFHGFSRATQGL